MKRWARILVALLLLVAAIGWLWHCKADRGPVYKGRRVADWVEDAMREDTPQAARDVVLSIGAPAVPFIVKLGLHDPSHQNHRLAIEQTLIFCDHHPFLSKLALWSHVLKLHNCACEHDSARWILSMMGTNAVAAVPDVIDCFEHCPNAHYVNGRDLLDTLGDICSTNPVAITYFTRIARGTNSYCVRAAVTVYQLSGDSSLLVETCERLGREDPQAILPSSELWWFRNDDELNQHLVPLYERLFDDPRLDDAHRGDIMDALQWRSNDATAAIARLLARQTNAAVTAQKQDGADQKEGGTQTE